MVRMMAAWVRGSHPLCGWVRLFLLPLMVVPMWFGHMFGGMLIMTLWMLFPLAFRKLSDQNRWMTRACLGVQIWRSRPLNDPSSLLLLVISAATLVLSSLSAGRQDPFLLGPALAMYFGAYLMFLRRNARSFDAQTKQLSQAQ